MDNLPYSTIQNSLNCLYISISDIIEGTMDHGLQFDVTCKIEAEPNCMCFICKRKILGYLCTYGITIYSLHSVTLVCISNFWGKIQTSNGRNATIVN